MTNRLTFDSMIFQTRRCSTSEYQAQSMELQ